MEELQSQPSTIADGCVTLGRNVGTAQMSVRRWYRFIDEVSAAITRHGGVLHLTARGRGSWDGVPEDATVVVFGGVDVDSLARSLLLLAIVYEQECIALVIGTSVLLNKDVSNSVVAAAVELGQ